jgi:hypothetical protein
MMSGKEEHARKYLNEDNNRLYVHLDMYQKKTHVCHQNSKKSETFIVDELFTIHVLCMLVQADSC